MTFSRLKYFVFSWQGITPQGQLTSGEISAASINLAKLSLAKKGLKNIIVKKKKITLFKKTYKIKPHNINIFFRQLATLLIAGIPIAAALQVLHQNAKELALSFMLKTLKDDIDAGNQLAFCLQKFPHAFDSMTCSLIHAGEKSGTLDIMLERIALHKEKRSILKNKIKQALFYPIIIVTVAVLVTIIMLTFVVPRFAELFNNMHTSLPLFTLMVIHLADFMQRSMGIFALLIIVIGGLLYSVRNKPRVKLSLDRLLLNIPISGMLLQKFILASFARSLATVFAAGIPITEALKILISSTGNALYAEAIQKLYLDISVGKQLHFAMQTCKLFPSMMLQMIEIGEESGTLEKMLTKISEFYEADLNHIIGNLSKLMEPLIMIILGVVIGGLVIAMYLPIFKLGAVI